jgi:hypothetical protein
MAGEFGRPGQVTAGVGGPTRPLRTTVAFVMTPPKVMSTRLPAANALSKCLR